MLTLKKVTVAVLSTMACLFALAAFGYNLIPECPTEDSSNCVWYADAQGNGEGSSFIDLGGTVYFLP